MLTLSFARRWHRRLDDLSGWLILFLVAFAPWGAGATLLWSSWTLIGTGWALGALLLLKKFLETLSPYRPVAWESDSPPARWPARLLAAGTVLILLQVGISVWNARAEVAWNVQGLDFIYRDSYIDWLPTTYDFAATRKALFRYLAFAAAFWAVRDWIRIKSRGERHRAEDGRDRDDVGRVPDRIRILGWTVALNGALMALLGILHRLDGSKDVLWVISLPNPQIAMTFGSYPYRANAAQYLNLMWPIALGLWWALRTEALRPSEKPFRMGERPYPILLICVAVMLGGIVMAASRGGIFIALAQLVFAVGILGRSLKGTGARIGLIAACFGSIAAAWFMAGDLLTKRFENTLVDDTMSGRTVIYESAHKIAADFPVWGSGAESFVAVNGLYRSTHRNIWHGYVHDDWLETRATLGWVGLGASLLLLLSVGASKAVSGRVPIGGEMMALMTLGMLGMLLHAKFDFPFQIPSLHLSFLVFAAVFSLIGPVPPTLVPGAQGRPGTPG